MYVNYPIVLKKQTYNKVNYLCFTIITLVMFCFCVFNYINVTAMQWYATRYEALQPWEQSDKQNFLTWTNSKLSFVNAKDI